MRTVSTLLFVLITICAFSHTYAQAPLPIFADPIIGEHDPIIGSKHDFTGLNQRAGVTAMAGLAYADYGNPCVYCHLSPAEAGIDTATNPGVAGGTIEGWNRFTPAATHKQYDSPTMDAAKVRTPNSISLLCLSCHDGTMAIDMVVFKPNTFKSEKDNSLHMKMKGGSGTSNCGQCHDGRVAHDINSKVMGTDLRDEHPISIEYGGLNWKDKDFKLPESPVGFANGVKLYNNNVECASCHNLHDPSNELLLTERREILCATCHTK
jgi:predicted CXXCH cytochrome family protein